MSGHGDVTIMLMLALQLQPGTPEEFASFCNEIGADADIGLTVDDFTTACK